MKIDITKRYFENEEVRTNREPYQAYYDTLSSLFQFENLKSFCDVGCATGILQEIIKTNHPNVDVLGLEYFSYHKEKANPLIRETIMITDLRDELKLDKKFDIVNCTETGEHIDKEHVVTFLANLRNLTGKFLVISWSDSGGEDDPGNDPHHQHLNPLKREEFYSLMQENGFSLLREQTGRLLLKSNRPHFHDWWRKSLSIWKVKT